MSGKAYVKYGGDTTCMEIRTREDEIIIVDAGTGIRRLGNLLLRENRHDYHLIFTHAHLDHIQGFPFFKPFYTPDTTIRMYRCPFSSFVETMLSGIMAVPYFPVPYNRGQAEITYAEDAGCATHFRIGSIDITPVPLSHPNTGRGYKFTENGKSFVFLTDNELHYDHPGRASYETYVEFARGADLLIHDAEYTTEEYEKVIAFGHSTYVDALELAFAAGVKRLGLFHLNQGRSDEAVDEMVARCRKIIADRGSDLECFAVGTDMSFTV